MDYWVKQTEDKPLFPELEWSKPENKLHAGKLLIIGGSLHGFSAPATAFSAAEKAGVGITRIILPDALRKTVGSFIPEADFCSSTPSGSFSVKCLADFIEQAAWADGVLCAGDLGRNSETAILLEKFVDKYSGPLTLTKDALDYFIEATDLIIDRPQTLLVGSFAQIQKIMSNSKFTTPITFSMDLFHVVEALHEFSSLHQAGIVTKHGAQFIVALNGQVSTTLAESDNDVWRAGAAAAATVWWLQHPSAMFRSITHSLVK